MIIIGLTYTTCQSCDVLVSGTGDGTWFFPNGSSADKCSASPEKGDDKSRPENDGETSPLPDE